MFHKWPSKISSQKWLLPGCSWLKGQIPGINRIPPPIHSNLTANSRNMVWGDPRSMVRGEEGGVVTLGFDWYISWWPRVWKCDSNMTTNLWQGRRDKMHQASYQNNHSPSLLLLNHWRTLEWSVHPAFWFQQVLLVYYLLLTRLYPSALW